MLPTSLSSPRLPLGPKGLCPPPFQRAVPEAVPVVELPINQVALHQVDVVPADTTAAAADIPTLCQDPFLWEEAVVNRQHCGLCTASESPR